jgi:hypothetical protein
LNNRHRERRNKRCSRETIWPAKASQELDSGAISQSAGPITALVRPLHVQEYSMILVEGLVKKHPVITAIWFLQLCSS